DPVGAGLHRQVQVLDQLRHFRVGANQAVGKLQRVRGGVADAVDAVDLGDNPDQIRQVGDTTVMGLAAIAVDVLPEQGYFAHAIFGQVHALGQRVVERAADFFTAGIGHHAETAVLAAPFHDRYVGGRAIHARLGQAVELLDFREGHVDLGGAGAARRVDH